MPNLIYVPNKKTVHNHNGLVQSGWAQNKNSFDTDNRDQLTDLDYNNILAYNSKTWRFITKNFRDIAHTTVTVFGRNCIPIAIELSQWGFPITFITDTYESAKKADNDSKRHAGNFKDLIYFDYLKNSKPSKVVIFANVLSMLTQNYLFRFINLMLRRHRIISCSESSSVDWKSLLGRGYYVIIEENLTRKDLVTLIIYGRKRIKKQSVGVERAG